MTSVIDRVREDRTVISQRALQAYADPWLGYTTLDGMGQLVAEALLAYLRQAVAKIHCVSDEDSDRPQFPFSTDQAISDILTGREDEFVQEMKAFGQGYGALVGDDYESFVDAFRNRLFPGL